MSPVRRRWVPVAVAVVLLAIGAPMFSRYREARSSVAVAERLQDDLEALRAEVDACLATRGRMELRLQGLASETARLRQQVDSLEGLDPRGVPVEQYDRYLGLVDEYNQAIPEWERQAESLREFSPSCDSLVALHNTRADSLRQFLREAQIFPEGPGPAERD